MNRRIINLTGVLFILVAGFMKEAHAGEMKSCRSMIKDDERIQALAVTSLIDRKMSGIPVCLTKEITEYSAELSHQANKRFANLLSEFGHNLGDIFSLDSDPKTVIFSCKHDPVNKIGPTIEMSFVNQCGDRMTVEVEGTVYGQYRVVGTGISESTWGGLRKGIEGMKSERLLPQEFDLEGSDGVDDSNELQRGFRIR